MDFLKLISLYCEKTTTQAFSSKLRKRKILDDVHIYKVLELLCMQCILLPKIESAKRMIDIVIHNTLPLKMP